MEERGLDSHTPSQQARIFSLKKMLVMLKERRLQEKGYDRDKISV